MIYTVTLNPSLDYIIDVKHFEPGMVNRTTAEKIFAGGKGINVSMVLKNLGFDSTALGFLAGFTGKEIERQLEGKGISTDFICLEDGISRINMKIRSEVESEINGLGPEISSEAIKKMFDRLDELQEGDILVLLLLLDHVTVFVEGGDEIRCRDGVLEVKALRFLYLRHNFWVLKTGGSWGARPSWFTQ